MPFICTFQLNNGAISANDEVVFKQYIDGSFGAYHSHNVPIAEVVVNGRSAFIYSNGPGFPSTPGKLEPGDLITPETKIAYFAADGDDIPYGRPYAVIHFDEVISK